MIDASYFDEDYFETHKKSNYGSYEDYPFFKDFSFYLWKKYLPKSSLEIGCAKGFMVKWLNRLGIDARGIDISEYAIDHAPDEIKSKFICCDFSKYHYNDFKFTQKEFELVLCFETVEHIPEEKLGQFIKNLYESTGEYCIITTPIVPKDYDRLKDDKKDNDDSHVSLHDKDYWCDAFKKVGFEFIGMETWYIPKIEVSGVKKEITTNIEAPEEDYWRIKYVMVLKK